MKNDHKDLKNEQIIKILAESGSNLSIRALHKRITRFYEIEISYRSLERKVLQMVKMGALEIGPIETEKYCIKPGIEFMVTLSIEEITGLFSLLPEGHPLSYRLKATMRI